MAHRPDPQTLPDDALLTQYGERHPFGDDYRDRLRVEIGETEISMILGEVDSTAAAMLVTHRIIPGGIRRVVSVGRLRQAGFPVVHSPTKGNPLHVSILPPQDEAGEPVEWGDDLAKRFNACFTEERHGRRNR